MNDAVGSGTGTTASGAPRSPLLRRQPSAPSTLQHVPAIPPPQQSVQSSVVSPRLRPVSETRHAGPPSITSIGTSSVHRSSARRNPPLRAPLQRLSSYSHGEQPYSSDEDSESAAEADVEAVQQELERSWEGHGNTGISTGTIRQRRRHSGGTSRGKGSQRGGGAGRSYEDDTYNTSTIRRSQTTPYYHSRHESDLDDNADEDRPQSHLNRHQNDDEDETTSDGVPDSEASFTLKDRQDAINITHPFGLKIWKPALYKKSRSVQRTAEGEIHSRPGQWPDRKIRLGNVLWTLLFGWWMGLVTALVACIILASTWWSVGAPYAFVYFGLARYLFYPFGRFIELTPNEAYAEEDEGEGRSISEYERYGAVDLERGRQLGIFSSSPVTEHRRGLIGRRRGQSIESWGEYSEQDSLLGGDTARATTAGEDDSGPGRKRRFFGRGQWSVGRIFFFTSFYLIIGISPPDFTDYSTHTPPGLWILLAYSLCFTHGKSNVRHRLPPPSSSSLNDIPFRSSHSRLTSSRHSLRSSSPLYLPRMGLGILQIHHRRNKHIPFQPRFCRLLYYCRRIFFSSVIAS